MDKKQEQQPKDDAEAATMLGQGFCKIGGEYIADGKSKCVAGTLYFCSNGAVLPQGDC